MKSTETVRILNRGKSFEYSRWEPFIQYTNDCFKQDFVSYENCILACVKSHLSDPNNEPHLLYENQENKYLVTGVDSEYWELVIPYTPGVIYIPNYNEETGELTWSISNKPEDVQSTLIDNFVWRKPEGLTSASLGKDNIIEGNYSMVAGEGLEAKNDGEVAFGKYNKSVSNTKFTIGIGDSNIRRNAVEVTDEGEVYIKGIGSYNGTNIGSSKDLSFAFNELPFIRRGIGYNSIKYGAGSIAGLYYTKIYLRGIDYASKKVYLSADETADIVTSNFSEVYDAKIDLSPYLNNYVFFIYYDGTLERSLVTQTKGNILYLSSLRSSKVLSNKVYSEEPIRFNNFLDDASNASAFQSGSALDDCAHAEGGGTLASGSYSHAEGRATITTNTAEHAEGKYNKSNEGTQHSVGIGTSRTNRKNAHEIMQDGKHYIYGIGNYDGTNPTNSEDLAKVINNKAEKTDIVQADYIENNISNKSYIINKPCSIDYITISDNPVISDMYVSGFENSETYEVSQQYNKYMNIIGLCVAKDNSYNEVIYVPIKYGTVNTFYHQAYDDGGFQIYIYIDAVYGPLGVGQIKVKSSHKITKIIGVAGFNKINENFIPSTIARQSEITRLENRIAELEDIINQITIKVE